MEEQEKTEKQELSILDQIDAVLRTCYDPEIPVNIVDLGLIYETKVDDDMNVYVKMTVTAPNCPAIEFLPNEVVQKIEHIDEVKSVHVEMTFEPPWDQTMMSDAARLELGFM